MTLRGKVDLSGTCSKRPSPTTSLPALFSTFRDLSVYAYRSDYIQVSRWTDTACYRKTRKAQQRKLNNSLRVRNAQLLSAADSFVFYVVQHSTTEPRMLNVILACMQQQNAQYRKTHDEKSINMLAKHTSESQTTQTQRLPPSALLQSKDWTPGQATSTDHPCI